MAAAETPRRPAILLLEDDVQLRSAVSDNLAAEFEIETAANVEEAQLLLGTRTFDVLLCDHMMPGKMQGLDFLIEAQRRHPAAKRILVTGYMNPELLSRSVTLAGLHACLLKPVATANLRQAIRSVLGLAGEDDPPRAQS